MPPEATSEGSLVLRLDSPSVLILGGPLGGLPGVEEVQPGARFGAGCTNC